MLENVPGAREKAERGELLFGTVETWLIWKLTGGKVHVTDYSNASRTMLYNIVKLEWDEEIMAELGIPRCMLPEVRPSSCGCGEPAPGRFGGGVPGGGAAGGRRGAGGGRPGPLGGGVGILRATGPRHYRPLRRPGVHGTRRAALGCLRPRHDSGTHARREQVPHHPRDARITGVSDL